MGLCLLVGLLFLDFVVVFHLGWCLWLLGFVFVGIVCYFVIILFGVLFNSVGISLLYYVVFCFWCVGWCTGFVLLVYLMLVFGCLFCYYCLVVWLVFCDCLLADYLLLLVYLVVCVISLVVVVVWLVWFGVVLELVWAR